MLKSILTALAFVLATTLLTHTMLVGVAHASCLPGFCDGGGDDGGGAGSQSPSSQEDTSGGGRGGPGGNGGDLEPLSPQEHIARLEKTCNAALQNLAPTPESLVKEFAPDGSVAVIPVCNSGLGHKASIDGSQALPLHDAIAANPSLSDALRERGFQVEDVVGIVVSNGIATLYVHRGAGA